MAALNMATFTNGSIDLERKQYQVLQGLKEAYDHFSHNRLYPTLRDLIDLHAELADIIKKVNDMEGHIPKSLTEIDLTEQRLIYEPHSSNVNMDVFISLVEWAMPLLKKTIEEGMEIYNFVEEHVSIDQVGILPVYLEEGYWFVPDRLQSVMHLLRYEVSLFSSTSERYRTLKTRFLESVEETHMHKSPEVYKHELMSKYSDLPNPATFVSETDIEFPFQETVMPVAKRKLMARVFA